MPKLSWIFCCTFLISLGYFLLWCAKKHSMFFQLNRLAANILSLLLFRWNTAGGRMKSLFSQIVLFCVENRMSRSWGQAFLCFLWRYGLARLDLIWQRLFVISGIAPKALWLISLLALLTKHCVVFFLFCFTIILSLNRPQSTILVYVVRRRKRRNRSRAECRLQQHSSLSMLCVEKTVNRRRRDEDRKKCNLKTFSYQETERRQPRRRWSTR